MPEIEKLMERLVDFDAFGEPIDEQGLQCFEQEIGATLPDDYREFLLTRNGGRLYYNTKIKNTTIECLSGFGMDDVEDLRWMRKCFLDRVPEEFLVLGGEGYSFLCMCLEPKRHGWIYYWDRSDEMTTPFHKMSTLLCKSFSSMLRNLQPNEYSLSCNPEKAKFAPEPFRSILFYDLSGLVHYLNGSSQK